MKKNLLLLAMLMITFMAQTQIVKEHDYTGSTNLVKLAISGDKYYNMDWSNNQCRLYNIDHSLWKTINLEVPSGLYLYDIRQVSETLFNLDPKVELAYVYYAYDTVLYYYTYETRIINENGLELLVIPGASYTEVKTTTSDGTKLLAWVYDYSVLAYTVHTMVYSLPGQQGPTGTDYTGVSGKADPAFPNPGHDMVTIPYVLPEGINSGTISITDVKGRFTRNYAIGRAFSNLQVSTAGWPRGIYFYRIEAAGQVSAASKIIIE